MSNSELTYEKARAQLDRPVRETLGGVFLDAHLLRDIGQFREQNPSWCRGIPTDEICGRELIDAWLTWNGIYGFTDNIIDLVLQSLLPPEDLL